jgi:two-component system sensor histidine kinase TctE
MRDAVLRTGNFTNRLLALARAEQSAPAARHDSPIDLGELAERVGAQWIAPALDRGIDLGFDLSPAAVQGDPLLLADMLQNLIDNAVRYTGSGGVITVSSGEDVGDAWLAVEDNGIGIPVSERTRVFERFYRGAAAGGDGCGLGLAIVKEGAERHRATVTIDDAPGGRGTLVRVHFPAASKPSSPSHEDAYATA